LRKTLKAERLRTNGQTQATSSKERMPHMLVLSRHASQKIRIPNFNTVIQVVSIKGSSVRIGIEAPPEVLILRDELQQVGEQPPTPLLLAESAEAQLRALRHWMRNRVNGATIGLALLRKQLATGHMGDLERTIALIEGEVTSLREKLETQGEKAATPAAAPRLRKALLVEDEKNERELLAGFLRMSGFSVDTAGDGCDALDYLRAGQRPDVVLMDMGLPRCDGPTTVREIRRNPAHAGLRIFAVSGHSQDEYDLEQGPGGIDRWFHKPLDPAALLRSLNQ
jgi:carbon storage regulator CsrA